jgi:hypothetical protein
VQQRHPLRDEGDDQVGLSGELRATALEKFARELNQSSLHEIGPDEVRQGGAGRSEARAEFRSDPIGLRSEADLESLQ